jgi:hypothetical protein
MSRLFGCAAGCVAVLALALVVRADDEDEKVPLEKVPAKVKDALKAKYPKAKIVSASKGDHDGTKVYEFKLEQGDKTWEASFTLDGKFDSSEEVIKESELPKKVKEAFRKKYKDVKVETIEKETTGEGEKAKVVYEIVFEKDKEKYEAQYDPEGKHLGEKKIKPRKKEEEKKDK